VKKKIRIPKDFVGEKWSGVYVVRSLTSEERDRIDELVTEIVYNENIDRWLPKMDEKKWKKLLVLACVENPKVTKASYKEIPPKLLDVLWEASRKLNYASEREMRFLLSKSTSGDQA